ncbi:prepilin peptidase [Alcaligenes sp. AB3]|uniref:A24 family peptidase n=1 Tax=Alcaligenes TaxID=507 RepID=UPI0018D1A16C|nr:MULTISPECIES: prepilin peptidase [Alcaligenes]MBH0309873.1 prepilin peptidase [Alcaligenes faecalis]MDT0215792.1 prepilin peptidase [Alcaligenes sp. AB3]
MFGSINLSFIFILIFFSVQILYRDLKLRKIPNSLLVFYGVTVVLHKVLVSVSYGLPWGWVAGWGDSLIGFAAALIVFYPVWLLRLMGAADVKLMAVLGLALGWKEAGMVVLFGTVLAGLHALILVLIPSLERKYGFALPGTRVKARSVPLGAWLSLATMGWVWIQNQ